MRTCSHSTFFQLKASAANKEKENKAAHESQQLARAEMARAVFVRNQADREIIEAKEENDVLRAEISKVKIIVSYCPGIVNSDIFSFFSLMH